MQKILVLAPHPDDAEFSSGGSIARWAEEGAEIRYMVFSPCSISLPDNYTGDDIFNEQRNAASKLGVKNECITFFNFPVRRFPDHRQEILEELVKIRREYAPDVVLLPNSNDVHQDHHTIYEEGIRAFKTSCILGYELSWNNYTFDNDFYLRLTQEQVNKKVEAISEYKSQSFRTYLNGDLFVNLAKMRGLQINTSYAECFELIRWIL
ncbi:MAG: PIG-L family deacetylase [Prolixibacteraceae bacterium]|nr:PIG-L family deacetylase [Prolixibacteraceae bacterium]